MEKPGFWNSLSIHNTSTFWCESVNHLTDASVLLFLQDSFLVSQQSSLPSLTWNFQLLGSSQLRFITVLPHWVFSLGLNVTNKAEADVPVHRWCIFYGSWCICYLEPNIVFNEVIVVQKYFPVYKLHAESTRGNSAVYPYIWLTICLHC